jgi:hypothetical protein
MSEAVREGLVSDELSHHEELDEIELPGSSLWPPLLALGVTLLLLGVIFRGLLTVAGVIVFVIALGGWIFEEELVRRRARRGR